MSDVERVERAIRAVVARINNMPWDVGAMNALLMVADELAKPSISTARARESADG